MLNPGVHVQQRAINTVLAILAVALTAYTMAIHGFPVLSNALFAVIVVTTTVVPGFVWSTWAADTPWLARLAVSFTIGLPAQLLGWFAAVSTGWAPLTWIVPLGIAAGGAVLMRKRLVEEFKTPKPALGVAGAGAAFVLWLLALTQIAQHWWLHPMQSRHWYQDLYWHLAINASAMHRVPVVDPQAIGEQLSYHWLSNAHVAGLTLAGGFDLQHITRIGWIVPIYAATLGLVLGLTHYLSRSTTAGLLAVAFVIWQPIYQLNTAFNALTTGSFIALSPSHLFNLPIAVALLWLIIVVVRSHGPRRYRALPALIGLTVMAPGAKISLLPVFACGVIAALALSLLTRHRRGILTVLVAFFGIVTVLTLPIFGGGGGGSSFELFGGARQRPLYIASADTLSTMDVAMRVLVVVAFVTILVLNHLWWAVGLGAFHWRDPVAWLFMGIVGASLGVTLLLVHPGQSQVYFATGIQPIAAVMAGVGLHRLAQRTHRQIGLKATLALGVAGIAGGLIVRKMVALTPALAQLNPGTIVKYLALSVVPVVVVAAVGLLAARRKKLFLATVLLIAVFVTSLSSAPSILTQLNVKTYRPLYTAPAPSTTIQRNTLNQDEIDATAWAARHLPADAVLATNVHCMSIATSHHCDNRGFWVAALTERHVLLGGWGYTTLGRSTQGIDGRRHTEQPYPDTALFDLNESAFYAPSANVMDALRKRGVTHLLADSRAKPVSPSLTRHCTEIYRNDTVTICQIAPVQ